MSETTVQGGFITDPQVQSPLTTSGCCGSPATDGAAGSCCGEPATASATETKATSGCCGEPASGSSCCG